jgi:hypothetical protein
MARGGLVSNIGEYKAGKRTRVPYRASGLMCEGPDSAVDRACHRVRGTVIVGT